MKRDSKPTDDLRLSDLHLATYSEVEPNVWAVEALGRAFGFVYQDPSGICLLYGYTGEREAFPSREVLDACVEEFLRDLLLKIVATEKPARPKKSRKRRPALKLLPAPRERPEAA